LRVTSTTTPRIALQAGSTNTGARMSL